jgi:hypothetical protein
MCLATTACLKDAPLSSRSRLHISSKSFSRAVSTLTTKDIQALLTQWVYVDKRFLMKYFVFVLKI